MKYTSKERRQWLVWHANQGSNIAATSRQFGVSRSTLYRWLRRYDPDKPSKPLRAHSRRPHNRRKPSWSKHHLAALADISATNPEWGRRRLHWAVVAGGWPVSESTIGRMLSLINRKCPVCRKKGFHFFPSHLVKHDVTGMGFTYPLANSPRRSKVHASKRAKDTAVREAEEIIRGEYGEREP